MRGLRDLRAVIVSGWRKITYEGTEYRWRFGQTYVVVRKGRIVFARALPEEITGRTPDIFERGQWKRTSDGMVKPGHVLGLIRRAVKAMPERFRNFLAR